MSAPLTRPGVLAVLTLVAGLAQPRPTLAQTELQIAGQIDLAATARPDDLGVNTAARGDNPFNPIRLRLYARRWVTDRVGIFTELLYDWESGLRVNGAYVVVNELGGKPWLNARLGFAPALVGSFGLRSTYFNSNPLVGVPLVWQYKTNLDRGGTSTAASLTDVLAAPGPGVPMMYDACWNVQWELLGELGAFEYSVGLTPGSLSNPVMSRRVEGHQWMARVGYVPLPGLRLGLSGAHGPYLSAPRPDDLGNLPYPEDPSDFDQSVWGVDVELARGRWLFHSEVFGSRWETPLVAEALGSVGGYLEARYDFATGWYAATRLETMTFGDVVTDSGTGATAPWDADVRRGELLLGYRLSREVLLKAGWQRTETADPGFEQNLFTMQLSSVF